jgi:preprotein translocase subunit SecA
MCLECPYELPALLLRKIAERIVKLSTKLNRESLSERDIEQKTERLLCHAIELILRQYIPDYQHDDNAVAEEMLSKLWEECGQKSLYALTAYENELTKISNYLLDRYEQLVNTINPSCITNTSQQP